MKKIYLTTLFLLLIFGVISCGGDKITGEVVKAELTKNFIKNGETISLMVDGKNTGNKESNVLLNIIPEDSNLLRVSYPGSLEDTLQPGEQIGVKIIKVQGFTQHSQTRLWIKTQLINKDNQEILDEDIQWLTIEL